MQCRHELSSRAAQPGQPATPPGQTSGLSFIHGYNGGGGGTVPVLRSFDRWSLSAIGCTAADLSAPYFTLGRRLFGNGPGGDRLRQLRRQRRPAPTLSGLCDSERLRLERLAAPGGALGTWTGAVNLPAGSGRQTRESQLESGNNEQGNSGNCANNQPNSGTFPKVAAPYVANHSLGSGPVPRPYGVQGRRRLRSCPTRTRSS